jgi:hypothetical protein
MTYFISVDGEPGPRARIDVTEDDALRIGQALANTEGVDVEINGPDFAVAISGDETQYPQLTLEERTWIVTTPVLIEMHEDAMQRTTNAAHELHTITTELNRRAAP